MKKRSIFSILGIFAVLLLFISSYYYTQARLISSKTAKTNLTLAKGSVYFSDLIDDSQWKYIGNYAGESLDNVNIAPSNYLDVPINGDLINNSNKPLAIDKSQLVIGESFKNIKSGDTFYRTFDIQYKKDNEKNNPAEYIIKMDNPSSTNVEYFGKYYVVTSTQKTNQEIYVSGAQFYPNQSSGGDNFIKNGQTVRVMILLRVKNSEHSGESFKLKMPTITIDAKNYLEKVK